MDSISAIAHPTRRAILDMLAEHERPAMELVASFSTISQPAISKHLRILREAGLVSMRVQAQQRIYNLEPKALAELGAWISKYQTFWPEYLDAFERHLSSEKKQSKGL